MDRSVETDALIQQGTNKVYKMGQRVRQGASKGENRSAIYRQKIDMNINEDTFAFSKSLRSAIVVTENIFWVGTQKRCQRKEFPGLSVALFLTVCLVFW